MAELTVPAGTDPAAEPGPQRPSGRPRWLAQLPLILVMALVVLALVWIVMYRWKRGSAALAGAMFLAATFRTLLSPEACGLLAIRGRPVDVMTYIGFGLTITYIAATIPP